LPTLRDGTKKYNARLRPGQGLFYSLLRSFANAQSRNDCRYAYDDTESSQR